MGTVSEKKMLRWFKKKEKIFGGENYYGTKPTSW